MSDSLLKNVVVTFDLPFVLRLIDSVHLDSRPTDYQDYIFPLGGVPAMLRFEKKVRSLPGIQVAIEDRRGVLTYSVVQVWFDQQFFKVNEVQTNYQVHTELLKQAAITYVNRFLDLYRDITGCYWIRPVHEEEVPIFHMLGIRGDSTRIPFAYSTVGTGVGLGSQLPSAQDNQLRAQLVSGEVPDPLQRLAFVISDLMTGEDYWSAALAIEILFEAKVARMLRVAFQTELLSEGQIDRKFVRSDGNPMSITNLLTTYIAQLTGSKLDTNSPIVWTYQGMVHQSARPQERHCSWQDHKCFPSTGPRRHTRRERFFGSARASTTR
ncbi:MAG: hypothetical protein HY666_03465 [Chloroflexi bacterium]|nr:hypothetical protein [Chloroflexota bacterium]